MYYKTKQLLTGTLLLLLVTACGSSTDKNPEYLFRASMLVKENHTWYKAFIHFGKLIEERSDGRMKLEVYPSEQLAKELEAIRLIKLGVIDMTISAGSLTNFAEILTFSDMPFLLKDTLAMHKLINSDIGKRIEREMIEKIGLRPLGYFQRGERHLTSNRPIKHPDDLQELIIRVPNAPSYVVAWKALGAKPTPMAFSEVFSSLQQGTIEAQENPFAMIKNAGFSEVQKYLNLTGHLITWGYPLVGEKQFQSLPKDLKAIFLQAAREMQVYEHRLFLDNESKVQKQLKDEGMIFVEVDKIAFMENGQEAVYESLSPQMQEVYKSIKKITQ
ncbi:MAG: TRAP transporter substrate-binding protein [Flavobacteriaceae bacterium]|jgi:tripartite ATP-independent transporter DctP family solute receptor|nr:TRAP transporter substrate-binding protein [Flavobacteriaceae bacterium]RPG63069.1 MAG: TRAP transporter substrate-binding protein [Flavobacteriaceae bacterium TMED42]|tara:strand:- start:397 stop:1386 length:990 start_codon:yes stop_codon:yes gene_type:complete